jgi:hypothetical protein
MWLDARGPALFLNALRSDLEDRYTIYCGLRDEVEPRYFRFLTTFADGGSMHVFEFVIDDSTSPDHLFIEDFEHESGPL